MGTSMSAGVPGKIDEKCSGNMVKKNNNCWALKTPLSDYRFDRFVRACFQLQKEKKWLEVQVRIELQNWRLRAKKGEPSAECRHRISECLKMFKCVQETQDALIEKEKSRINSYGNDIGEDAVRNLKARLKFFSVLNEQHEALLEMVRRDVQDCRAICRKVGDEDSQIRYRVSPKP